MCVRASTIYDQDNHAHSHKAKASTVKTCTNHWNDVKLIGQEESLFVCGDQQMWVSLCVSNEKDVSYSVIPVALIT